MQQAQSQQFVNNLTDEQILRNQQAFDEDFGRAVDATLTDPAMRQRFNQLQLQYRGFGAFASPVVQQQLNLTLQQQQRFRLLARDYRQELAQLNRLYATDPATAIERFNLMQQQFNNQLSTVLSAQQLQAWREMVGQPYQFDPTMFVGAGTAQTRTSARLDPQGNRVDAEFRTQRGEAEFDTDTEGAVGTAAAGTDVGTAGSDLDVGTAGTEAEDFEPEADNDLDINDDALDDADSDLDDNQSELNDDLDGDNVDDTNTGADRSTNDSAAR